MIVNENETDEDEFTPDPDQCHVCLLPRMSNFALLHGDCVHGGFCEARANQLSNMGANCPICREPINGIVRIFQ